MKYYVFAESGGCNDGDHQVDFIQFDTETAAREWMKENTHWDRRMVLISGFKVTQVEKE